MNNIMDNLATLVATTVRACFGRKRDFSGEIRAFKQIVCEVACSGVSWQQHLSDVVALNQLRDELAQDYYDHIVVETQGSICPSIARLLEHTFQRDFNLTLQVPITCTDYDLGGYPTLEWWLDGVMPAPYGWDFVDTSIPEEEMALITA